MTYQLIDAESEHFNQLVVMTLRVKLRSCRVAPGTRARTEVGNVEKKKADRLEVTNLLGDIFAIALNSKSLTVTSLKAKSWI